MTVAQLIEALRAMRQDAEIVGLSAVEAESGKQGEIDIQLHLSPPFRWEDIGCLPTFDHHILRQTDARTTTR